MNRQYKRWTKEELQYIVDNYQDMTAKEIGYKLGRTASAVAIQVHILGLTKKNNNGWTDEEIQYLKDNYYNKSAEEIANKLGKNKYTLYNVVCELGLSNKYRTWTKEEEEFLKENYTKYTREELSAKLNRTKSAIAMRLQQLGLTVSRLELSNTTEFALYQGDDLIAIGTLKELSQELDIPIKNLKTYGYPSYMKKTKGIRAKRLVHIGDSKDYENMD